ncbi:lamin tail domain-containing protein [Nodularia harveyana UHCC-0300]|uniref:Lamin tail domain-containing protein n=1 Tax=Nodularia harveyana UHCC-0300 TaxID=2974287 RepID=A0ABU5UEB7_9CYAN|nr:lamin tail domain-containing protein [Nodularia harveyana]MEA5581875.1 lamin tail domain-containing protein [Nodularia harveyana UHCC-0300]
MALTAGNIAFVGFNADGNDNIAFVALVDINPNEVIIFEDNEWNGTTWNDTNEGAFSWTSDSLIAAGTIIRIDNIGSGEIVASTGTIIQPVAERGNNRGLSASGEVLYAYQGDASSPIFITAIAGGGFSESNGTLTNTGLTAGVNALDLSSLAAGGADVAAFNSDRTGAANFADYLPIINNPSNWIAQDGSGDQSIDTIAPDVPFSDTAFTLATIATTASIKITEYLYSGGDGEFVELTNISDTAVDLTGWSYSDSDRIPGTFSLSDFGTVQPGESVIFTETADVAAFRTAWGLDSTVKVIGNSAPGLGRGDEINIYDNNNQLVDRLTYDDRIAGVRTQNASGWTQVENLGINDSTKWQLSAIADLQSSVISTANDIGNPGSYATEIVPTIILTQTEGSISVRETGETDTYTLGLTTVPTAAVNINISVSDGQTLLSTDGVNFSANLSLNLSDTTPQTITVQAVDDGIFETKPHSGAIAHSISSTDPIYNSLTIPNLTVSITDNDTAPNPPAIRITEYQDGGNGSEFFEITNIGDTEVDLTGWSYDDESRIPGTVSLSAFGIVGAGESVIVTENNADSFRTDWGLSSSVKIIGELTVNLGREDEINIFDSSNQLIDSFSYGDTTKFPGTSRANGVSAWTASANLGNNDATQWTLSTLGDGLNSFNSLSGGLGNPGSYSSAAVLSPAVLVSQSDNNTVVTEGGVTDTYTIVLRSQPTADVEIAINPDDQLTVSSDTLTFTSANWNIPQSVTVNAVDDALSEGDHTGSISHSATSADAGYNGITVPTIATVNITDNDGSVGAVPTITENTTSPLINLPATGSGFLSGAIDDPTDPARILGVDLVITDADTPVENLTVTVTSNNQSVVPNANLNLTGSGGTRNLKIHPTGVGFADITISVSDGDNVVEYMINYGASAASVVPDTTRFHYGTSDASTAIAIDADYMLVADDEDQIIRLYDRNQSGSPITSFDFSTFPGLDGEVDLEGSVQIGNTIYWIGSHGNNSSNNDAPNRERIFATTVSGTGINTTLDFAGSYRFLEDDLIAWDNNNGHGLGAGFLGLAASAASGVSVSTANGFNIEGLTSSPDGNSLYVAFRTPLEPTSNRTQALIIPVTNFSSILDNTGGTTGSATFGAPIQLDLGDRGIRSIERNNTGEYVIIAGSVGAATDTAPNDFRLYTWTGNAGDAPVLRTADLTALNTNGSFEGIVTVPDNLTGNTKIQLLVDNGDTFWYNNSTASKDLDQDNFQKFRTEEITLDAIKIHTIQGAGHTSPLIGQIVTDVPGIVTAVDSNGFYLQDPNPDDNIATSEAIFVFTGSAPTVSVGDSIIITGTVSEFTPGGASTGNLSTTQIGGNPTITILSSGNALPSAVIIGAGGRVPPSQVIDDDGLTSFDPTTDGIDFYESLEGMRVTATDLIAVSATNRFGEIYTVADNGAGATGLSERGTINIAPDDFNPERIQIDADNGVFDFAFPNVNVGDRLGDVTGVVGYNFGNFEVIPTEDFVSNIQSANLQPEVTTLNQDSDTLAIATYNVLNLDPNDGDGDQDVADGRFNAIANQIVNNLKSPDIIGLQEIQDNSGSTNDGVTSASVTLQTLIDAITAAGGPTYQFIDNTFISNNNSGGQPGANIRNAFLYNDSRVDLVADSVQTVPSSSFAAFTDTRLPLIANFAFNGEEITVINNHFSSKGGSSPLFGQNQPSVGGESVGNGQEDITINGSLDQRRAQAQAVNDFVDGILATNPNSKVVVVGDLNEFEFISPLSILAGGSNPVLTNLTNTLPENERYTFNFDGNSQSLDHILVSNNLSANTQVDIVHVNSEFVDNAQRASDHDPILVTLTITENTNIPKLSAVGTPDNDDIFPVQGSTFDGIQNILFTGASNDTVDLQLGRLVNTGNNRINLGSGEDIIYVSRNDRAFGSSGDDEFDANDAQGGNRMSGGAGDDVFYLGSNDRALGGEGNDSFFVQAGGGNLLSGGAGNDKFWIVNAELPQAANTIVDFQIGADVIGINGAVSLGITTSTLQLNQVGADTQINFNNQTLAVLNNIQAYRLDVTNSNQFLLV